MMKLMYVVLAAPALLAHETLTIARLPIPFAADERPLCASATEDGRLVVYQSRRAGGRGGVDLWLSRYENGRWSEPFNAGPGVNSPAGEVDGKLSADGTTMVFIRGEDFKKDSDIYISRFRAGSWGVAERVGPPVSLPGTVEHGALLSKDGRRLYFASNRPRGLGGFDHYYSDRTGSGWSEPVNLGPVINTAGNDVDIAVSSDQRTIVFPLKRADSIGDSTDLYISRRVGDGWSPPDNLGPRINTPGTDTCPWLGYDGRTLYLNSDWEGLVAGKKGVSAIWKVDHSAGF